MIRGILIKAIAAGLLSGVVIAVVGTIVWLRTVMWWQMRDSGGQGGLGAVSFGLGGTLCLALVGFALGFGFVLWRSRT